MDKNVHDQSGFPPSGSQVYSEDATVLGAGILRYIDIVCNRSMHGKRAFASWAYFSLGKHTGLNQEAFIGRRRSAGHI